MQKLRAKLLQPNLPYPDRIIAEAKLEVILNAREAIARAQTTYGAYKEIGNEALMEEVHIQAEKAGNGCGI